jgi:cobalt-zinc-cadmium efflux system membrane fusion protein
MTQEARSKFSSLALLSAFFLALLFLSGCGAKAKTDEAAEAPPATNVVEQGDPNLVRVDKPERFQMIQATEHEEVPQLHATGTISADVDHSVPVVSLASGRALALYAKLGDDVKKGQLLLKVQSSDVSNAYQTYQQAKADEQLSKTQLERSKLLYDKGAIALNDLQVAQDTEEKARVAVEASEQVLSNLGASANQASNVVNVYAPVSGTIVEQNVVQSASVHTPDNQPNLFTIADLSTVWALCDVFENDLSIVRLGDKADVELNGYPGRTFRGRISNISKVLDPNTRSAKVRIVLSNPGIMRTGMFLTATFYGNQGKLMAIVPARSILHLHDKDWVFIRAPNNSFRRVAITGGKTLDNNMQIVQDGIAPGQQVVRDALSLEAESEQ